MIHKRLKHFVLVAECLNYRRAAELAHLSQPAISHSIKSLEKQLDCELFDRTKRLVRLTPVGEGVFESAMRLLSESDNFNTDVENLRMGKTGRVYVGLATTIAEGLGGDLIAKFTQENLDIRLDISVHSSPRVLHGLMEEQQHIAICDTQTARSREGLTIKVLGKQHGGFFCRPGHPILKCDKPNLTLAHSFGFVSLNVTPSVARAMARDLKIDMDKEPLILIASDNVTLCRTVAVGTDRILIADHDYLRPHLKTGNLVEVDVGYGFEREICLATKRGRALPTAAELLIETLPTWSRNYFRTQPTSSR